MKAPLEDDGWCFACGRENPEGLSLKFERTEKGVRTTFIPQRKHQGFKGVIHGGILTTLLDEAGAHAAIARGFTALTAEININFKNPLYVGQEALVEGWLVGIKESRSKNIKIIEAGSVIKAEGKVIAEASSKMILR